MQQKRAKEELKKAQLMQEEEQKKQAAPKVNKKSLAILRQREQRLERERMIKQGVEGLQMFDDNPQPATARLKSPTNLY